MSWLFSRRQSPPALRPARRPSALRLESLEGRDVPSTLSAIGSAVGGRVQVYDDQLGLVADFQPFEGFLGSIRAATGDVNGDNFDDLVCVNGPGGPATVAVFLGTGGGSPAQFTGLNTTAAARFLAFDQFAGGAFVAVGDVDPSNNTYDPATSTFRRRAEIVVSTDVGAAEVRAFGNLATGNSTGVSFNPAAPVANFTAYAGFAGGVTLSLGDVDADRFLDIVTGTATQADHVKVFENLTQTPAMLPAGGSVPFGGFNSGSLLASFLAYGGFPNGIYVSAANLIQTSTTVGTTVSSVTTITSPGADVIVGPAAGPAHLKVFASQGTTTGGSVLGGTTYTGVSTDPIASAIVDPSSAVGLPVAGLTPGGRYTSTIDDGTTTTTTTTTSYGTVLTGTVTQGVPAVRGVTVDPVTGEVRPDLTGALLPVEFGGVYPGQLEPGFGLPVMIA